MIQVNNAPINVKPQEGGMGRPGIGGVFDGAPWQAGAFDHCGLWVGTFDFNC